MLRCTRPIYIFDTPNSYAKHFYVIRFHSSIFYLSFILTIKMKIYELDKMLNIWFERTIMVTGIRWTWKMWWKFSIIFTTYFHMHNEVNSIKPNYHLFLPTAKYSCKMKTLFLKEPPCTFPHNLFWNMFDYLAKDYKKIVAANVKLIANGFVIRWFTSSKLNY